MGTTAFPGAVDDFATTSPTNLGDDDSKGRTHSERHDDMESAMEAVQTRVLSGMELVTSGTYSATANLYLNGIFDSTHDDYVIVVQATGTSDAALFLCYMQTTVPATETGTVYAQGNVEWGKSVGPFYVAERDSTAFTLGAFQSTSYAMHADFRLSAPYLAAPTGISSSALAIDTATGAEVLATLMAGTINNTTQYAGILLQASSGTHTGTYRIYGLPK